MNTFALKKSHLKEVKECLQLSAKNAQNNPSKLDEIVQNLLILEKKTRHDNDLESSKLLAKFILQIYVDLKNWTKVCEMTCLLCGRHAQLKPVVSEVVRTAMESVKLAPSDDAKLRLLKELREIGRGKMHVEYEYAQATKQYSKMKENAGKISEAAEVLQEVNVEGLSAMSFEEKFDFLLEQFRLTLAVKDWSRAEVTAGKFNLPWLDKKSKNPEGLKKRYFGLIANYKLHLKNFLEVADAHLSLSQLRKPEDKTKAYEEWQKAALYSCLSPKGNLARVSRNKILSLLKTSEWKENEDSQIFKKLLLNLSEIKFAHPEETVEIANKCFALQRVPLNYGESMTDEDTVILEKAIKESIVKHNIEVAQKHFSKISLAQLARLTMQSEQNCEESLCEMARRGESNLRIDSVGKEVNFEPEEEALERVENWGSSVSATVRRIERVCGMIERERVLFGSESGITVEKGK